MPLRPGNILAASISMKTRSAATLFRKLFYPTMLGGTIALFFALKGFVSQELLMVPVVLISFLAVGTILVAEKIIPYRKDWNRKSSSFWSDTLFTNILLPIISNITEIVLSVLVGLFLSQHLRSDLSALWPSSAPLLLQLVLALLVCEFFFYWVHRWAHRIPLFWKFHAVHHVVDKVYWNNAGRFHPLDLFLSLFVYFMPLALFGVSPELMTLFLLINAVTGLLEHANVDFEAGLLNRFFNTAQLHRWHHSTVVKESSTNFGKVLSVWDQVFGTFFYPEDRRVRTVGIIGEKIPDSSWEQMTYPFRKKRTRRSRSKKALGKAVGLLVVASALSPSVSESATGSKIFNQFPVCFERANLNPLIVVWDESVFYERTLSALETRMSCAKVRSLRKARWVLSNSLRHPFTISWTAGQKNFIGDLQLSVRDQELLSQVRLGARWPRQEIGAKDFLRKHPIARYDFALNEELTLKYGIGFSGEVYQAWIDSRPENQTARQEFARSMQSPRNIESRNMVALVAMGLGWESDLSRHDEKTAHWVRDFAKEIMSTGLPSIMLQRKALIGVRENVDLIKPQIRETLASGNDVVLTGLCKGVAEMMMAWSEVEAENRLADGSRPAGWGRVRGILNMSGMNTGVYFADVMENTFTGRILKWLAPYLPMSGDLASADEVALYPKALESMTTAEVRQIHDRMMSLLTEEDRRIPVLNVVGVIKGRGIIENDRLVMNTLLKVNQDYQFLSAAHDGFLQYPGNEFTRQDFPLATTIAFEASHMLMDGSAYGYPLDESETRRRAYLSMYRALFSKGN